MSMHSKPLGMKVGRIDLTENKFAMSDKETGDDSMDDTDLIAAAAVGFKHENDPFNCSDSTA